MANIQWVYDNADPVMAPVVALTQAVAVGDMVALVSSTIVRAQDVAWVSAILLPGVFTGTDSATSLGTQGALTNTPTGVKISYQWPWGEGLLSALVSVTPTAHASIVLTGATLIPPSPALWTNIYTETSAGSGVYAKWGQTLGSSVFINSYGAGPAPWAGNSLGIAALSDATTLTQYQFALGAMGISAQATGTSSGQPTVTTTIYGNNLANVIRVNTSGVYRFPTASASYVVGNILAPVKAAGNTLLSQQVGLVTYPQIGFCQVVQNTTSSTTVLARLLTTPNALPV